MRLPKSKKQNTKYFVVLYDSRIHISQSGEVVMSLFRICMFYNFVLYRPRNL